MIKPNTIKNHYIQLYHIMLKILSLFIKLLGSLFYEGGDLEPVDGTTE